MAIPATAETQPHFAKTQAATHKMKTVQAPAATTRTSQALDFFLTQLIVCKEAKRGLFCQVVTIKDNTSSCNTAHLKTDIKAVLFSSH